MSGYPLRTPYDASKKRKEYLAELELRMILDDMNLQANKLYKRTGAVPSTPTDNRTTTEKLADLYRLRIDIRAKLGKMMSGEDAQKVVNELDQQELVFLTQRIDKFIAELKPKYTLGVPYQVFNTYFKNSIKDFNKFGELDATRLVLDELSANTDDTRSAIENLTREIQFAGKKEIIFKLENIDKLRDLIDKASYLLEQGAVNPSLEGQVADSIQAIENAVPTKSNLLKIQNDFEKAIMNGDIKTQDDLARQVLGTAVDIETLGNNIDDLQRIIQETTQQLPQVPIRTSKKIPSSAIVEYEAPYDPNKNLKVDELKELFQLLLEKAYGKPTKNPTTPAIPFVSEIFKTKLLPSLMSEGLDASRIRSGSTLFQKMRNELAWGVKDINLWLYINAEDFKKIFATEARNIPIQDPFARTSVEETDIYGGLPSTFGQLNPTGISSGLVSQPIAQPPPTTQPIAQPSQPPPTTQPMSKKNNIFAGAVKYFSKRSEDLNRLVSQIVANDAQLTEPELISGINLFADEPEFSLYNTDDASRVLLYAYVKEWLDDVLLESTSASSIVPIVPDYDTFVEFVRDKIRTSATGKGLKKNSKMKGKGVAIDYNFGMATDGIKKTNYVPFGKYIINRNKLNDSIVMIKRPNGAFMADIQTRRVSNKLRNVFEKIIGGSIPSYNDYNKLDDDEREYLHFVAKKSNLLDKLEVPTPNKSDDEKIQNRFEVLKGMIFAGNDNKQMIDEFKKLIIDMADKKLLPRRQVSDILIDIARVYG